MLQEITADNGHLERPSSNTSSSHDMPPPPIKVDIEPTAQSSTSVTSENDHQKHVLQQYSINQLQVSDTTTLKTNIATMSPRSQALHDLQKSTRSAEKKAIQENFTVPTPQLQLSDIWESEKSVCKVSSTHHFKPHSCRAYEMNRRNYMVEPHMVPTPVLSPASQTLSPFQTSPSDDPEYPSFASLTHERPILYNAWSVAKPNTPTKHSLLTSSRLMHR